MKFVDLFSEMLIRMSRLVIPRKRMLAALRVSSPENVRSNFRRRR